MAIKEYLENGQKHAGFAVLLVEPGEQPCAVQLTLTTVSTGGVSGPLIRSKVALVSDLSGAAYPANSYHLSTVDGALLTTIARVPTNGDILRLEYTSSLVTAKIKSVTDSSFTTEAVVANSDYVSDAVGIFNVLDTTAVYDDLIVERCQ